MEDKEMQAQFIQWLAQKTGAKSEQELTEVIKKLQSTEGAMEQTVQEFQAEMSGQQAQPTFKLGGKVSYLECLSKLKKGGKVGDCGCKPKVQKAQAGAALGLFKNIGNAFKGANSIIKGGTSAFKGAQTLATINKVAGYGQQALNIGKNVMGGMQPTTNAPVTQVPETIPPLANPVTGAPTATALNTRVAPTLQPIVTQARQPGMLPIKPITPKLIAQKGAKLKAVGKKSMSPMKK